MSDLKPQEIETAWNHLANDSQALRNQSNKTESLKTFHQYYNRQVTSDDDYHYLTYFHDKYFNGKNVLSIASFGSGSGFLEPILYKHGFEGADIIGYEINPNLVALSNQNAAKFGLVNLTYCVANLNYPTLPIRQFDLGIFFHSLHHIEKLESCLKTIADSLKPNGLLLVVEFVGQNFQQWTDSQINLATKFLSLMPEHYKILPNGEQKTMPRRPTKDEVIFHDPSESTRSEDILKSLDLFFEKIELVSLGGSILNHVFEDIASNFDEANPLDVNVIKAFQTLEQWLERSGVVSPDFIFGVYKPKSH